MPDRDDYNRERNSNPTSRDNTPRRGHARPISTPLTSNRSPSLVSASLTPPPPPPPPPPPSVPPPSKIYQHNGNGYRSSNGSGSTSGNANVRVSASASGNSRMSSMSFSGSISNDDDYTYQPSSRHVGGHDPQHIPIQQPYHIIKDAKSNSKSKYVAKEQQIRLQQLQQENSYQSPQNGPLQPLQESSQTTATSAQKLNATEHRTQSFSSQSTATYPKGNSHSHFGTLPYGLHKNNSLSIQPTKTDVSESTFYSTDWTPVDSSYGGAFPFCGWVPKRIRQAIEQFLLVVGSFFFVYFLVTAAIKLTGSRTTSAGGNIEFDDDHYIDATNDDAEYVAFYTYYDDDDDLFDDY